MTQEREKQKTDVRAKPVNYSKALPRYLAAKKPLWAESTYKSESARLTRLLSLISNNPLEFYNKTQHLSSYSRLTAWIRVVDFLLSCNPDLAARYKEFRKKNKQLFRNAYKKRLPPQTFEEVLALLTKIKDEQVKAKAEQLLWGGLRWSESFTYNPANQTVVGKGGKERRVYAVRPVVYTKSKRTFIRELAAVGLKPHDLRKIRATDLARRGLREQDLCKVFGWSSFNTASSYLAPLREKELDNLMNQL